MNKNKILSRMLKIVNEGKKGNKNKLKKADLEIAIEAFKQVMLECIEEGKDFNYRGFLEMQVTPTNEKERVNPKTQEPFLDHKKYKVNLKFAYSVKQFIKKIVAK